MKKLLVILCLVIMASGCGSKSYKTALKWSCDKMMINKGFSAKDCNDFCKCYSKNIFGKYTPEYVKTMSHGEKYKLETNAINECKRLLPQKK